MKRDMNLIRGILLRAEAEPTGEISSDAFEADGLDPSIVAEHMALLDEARFVHARVMRSRSTRGYQATSGRIERITLAGHDFLDLIRDDAVWREVRDRLESEGLGMPVAIVEALAVAVAQRRLGLSQA